jgi:hypothetical protein
MNRRARDQIMMHYGPEHVRYQDKLDELLEDIRDQKEDRENQNELAQQG